jgi:OOP family OmpA-OmpF porin
MRTIVTGIIVFILWSALCTWYYVTHIKGPVAEEPTAVEQTFTEVAPAETEPEPAVIEPETGVESPGSFTVYHAFNRSSVLPDAAFEEYINQLLAYQAESKASRLNLTGHTDNIGAEDYNDRLGLERAQSTRDYLVSKGFPADKINIFSKGESEPVATNETNAGRAQNRRTEIEVKE